METQSTSISPVQTATGPRTVEGKERSSRNAIKHGIFSKHLFLDDECRADFDKLHQGLREDFQPEGVMEQLLVEQLAITFLRWRRMLAAESVMFARSPASDLESVKGDMGRLREALKKIESANMNFTDFGPPSSLLPPPPDLDRIVRYESHLSREFDRKLSQLERLQRARRGHPPAPTIKIDLD
jgi:hypothetical protein